ncbi:MAG: metallophosphoesterase, partial [Flavobacteriaceae bacterium]|nr:metallophosphoesterase [Flavobacteriaceae bacterium]
MSKNNIILTFLITFLLASCASYKAQYKDENNKIQSLPDKPIDQTFYLIGDAGKSPVNGYSKGLKAFKNFIKNKDTKDAYAVFLGDNIYPTGLPDEDDEDYSEAKNNLQAQVNSLDGFEGEMVFIPGNHDWYADGVKGVKRQEKF